MFGVRIAVIALMVVVLSPVAQATTATFHGWETLPAEAFFASGRPGLDCRAPTTVASGESPSAAEPAPLAVPEPATLCLVAVGLSGMFVRRRKRRRRGAVARRAERAVGKVG